MNGKILKVALMVLLLMLCAPTESAYAQSDDSVKTEKKSKKDKKKKNKQDDEAVTPPIQKADDDIELVVWGNGANKEEATRIALRSAIEQTFGTFVSSNTQILNDELVKDEIVTVSSGNIKHFEYISENVIDGMTEVNIKAIVSIGKLISYAKSKGSSAELAGATFAMNVKMAEMNLSNEKKVITNLWEQCNSLLPKMFDYEISVSDAIRRGDMFNVPVHVMVTFNENALACQDIFVRTILSLAVPSNVREAEKNYTKFATVSLPTAYFTTGLKEFIQPLIKRGILLKPDNGTSNKDEFYYFYLRNETKETLKKHFNYSWRDAINNEAQNFIISDGISHTSYNRWSEKRFVLRDNITQHTSELFWMYPIFKSYWHLYERKNYFCSVDCSRDYTLEEISKISKFTVSHSNDYSKLNDGNNSLVALEAQGKTIEEANMKLVEKLSQYGIKSDKELIDMFVGDPEITQKDGIYNVKILIKAKK